MNGYLPPSEFRLYAVCVRRPQNLIEAELLRPVRAGVYDAVLPGMATIRMIVVHELPLEEQNSILHLFSANAVAMRYARDHYRPRSSEANTLLYRLFETYQEDPAMAIKLEEFVRETIDEVIRRLTPEELSRRLTPEQRLEGLSPEKRLEGLSPEKIAEILTPEQLRAILDAARRLPNANGGSADLN